MHNFTSVKIHIDLNADLGEGAPCDEAILNYVSSANIACGGHTGDATSMRTALLHAQKKGVALGAHPSFVDRANFGRSQMHPDPEILYHELCAQLRSLMQIAADLGMRLEHLKPHGALYNQAAHDPNLAQVLIRVIQECDPTLRLMGLAGSALLQQAQHSGLQTIAEAFADRRYMADGSLAPRSLANACIENTQEAVSQALCLIRQQPIPTIDGKSITIRADSLCVHGDGEHALQLIRAIHHKLQEQGIVITSLPH